MKKRIVLLSIEVTTDCPVKDLRDREKMQKALQSQYGKACLIVNEKPKANPIKGTRVTGRGWGASAGR